MKRVKVDFITNIAPHYRLALWRNLLNESELDVEFIYADNGRDSIRKIESSDLPKELSARLHRSLKNLYFRGALIWQIGVIQKTLNTEAEVIVFLGDMNVLSTWISVVIAKLRRKIIIFWGHGAYGHEGRIKMAIRRFFNSLSDMYFVYGQHGAKLLSAQGHNQREIHVVYNSLDHKALCKIREDVIDPHFFLQSDFFSDNTAPVLVFVGRLTSQKSLHLLIRVAKELNGKGKIVNILFVGDGPAREKLESLACSISGQVHFYGACYDEYELGRMIANADLCVSPGEVGLTAIHALSFGTPVCTHGAMEYQMPEAEVVIHGQTGVFYDRDECDLTKTVEWWLDQDMSRDEIRRNCYDLIDTNWNPDRQAEIIRTSIVRKVGV